MEYRIVDWVNNEMFAGKLFDSFDDAECYLSEFLGDEYDEDRGEYYIVENEG